MMSLKEYRYGLFFLASLFFCVASTSFTAGAEVLFDQSHGQRFVIEKPGPLQLSRLAETISATGLKVRSGTEPFSVGTLSGVKAVVISGPFAPLTEREIAALLHFVEQGGRLAVLLHIGQPVIPLLLRLGVDVANGVIRCPASQIDDNPLDFLASDLTAHPVTSGLKKIAFFGAWPLQSFGPQVRGLARSDATSWVDLDGDGTLGALDAKLPFELLVAGKLGRGEFLVFGDDAVFQNRFLTEYNQELANNFAEWIAGGQ